MTALAARTAIPGFTWPLALDGQPARTLALLHQLEASQWWPPEQLRAAQFRQLHVLLTHAARHAPAHRRRLAAAGFDPARALDEATWARIPILTRAELQAHAARYGCTVVPPDQGAITHHASGGSTGIPVRVRSTIAASETYSAAICRDQLWHGVDIAGPHARIRPVPSHLPAARAAGAEGALGLVQATYGAPLAWLFDTGPAHLIDYRRSTVDQVAFLARTGATNLETLPSNLRLLLTTMRDNGLTLPRLRAVRTNSEVVDPPLRDLCRAVLGCRILDLYSAGETGLMATQCPDHDHHHVASESCLLEVLDDDGRPCRPGETGRVIVTPLHNLATPLIRYEVGDRARLGPPCPCGRGLPVLAEIVGRTYDTLVLADGTRRALGARYTLARIPAVTEFQLVQTAPGAVELRIVAPRPLTPGETAQALDALRRCTGPDVELSLSRHDRLPRTQAGKLRLFTGLPPS